MWPVYWKVTVATAFPSTAKEPKVKTNKYLKQHTRNKLKQTSAYFDLLKKQ